MTMIVWELEISQFERLVISGKFKILVEVVFRLLFNVEATADIANVQLDTFQDDNDSLGTRDIPTLKAPTPRSPKKLNIGNVCKRVGNSSSQDGDAVDFTGLVAAELKFRRESGNIVYSRYPNPQSANSSVSEEIEHWQCRQWLQH
jgi:hypothetical protein